MKIGKLNFITTAACRNLKFNIIDLLMKAFRVSDLRLELQFHLF